MRKHRLAVAVLLLLCLFAQGLTHARSASITFDEGPHLAVGYTTLRTGDLRLQPVHIHPPLANVLAAAPLLLQKDLPDPRAVDGWEIASLSAVTDAVVWRYPHPRRLALVSRFPIILMTLLLGAVTARWAADLLGPRSGLVALALYAFDPNVVAHGSLVTTDAAVTLWGTVALFLTARYLGGDATPMAPRHTGTQVHRELYWAGAGIALGLALASKVSAVSLLPALCLLLLLGPAATSWRRRILATMGTLFLSALTLWAVYGCEVGSVPGFPLPLPAATHVKVYLSLREHYDIGHPSFLLGQNGDHGWWYYFPVAFLLKTPLPTLILLVVAGAQIADRARRAAFLNRRCATRRWGPLVLFPLVYCASSLFSSVNIGYRHLLPVLPFLFIFASRIAAYGSRIARWASRITRRVLRFTLYVSLAWLALATLRISPHYLAFFNALAGGPAGGYRYLVDSNLDWGQNLGQLHDWMKVNGVERIYYAHFSPARPQVYGVEADFLPPHPRAVGFAPFDPAPGVYAIGATVLQGVYTPDVNTYAWFRAREPLARLGHALFVYRVPSRPQPVWAGVCANPQPVLSPEEVRERFGRPEMRLLLFDCGQSWVYPAEGPPGAYVLPAGAEPPPDAAPDVAARRPDGRPFYAVYRVEEEGAATPAQQAGDVTVDGPLAFLGYRLDDTDFRPGGAIELHTFWEVKEAPGRPLSLMAHVVGSDEVPVAVGDGLGGPVDQWRRGDVIVQRHLLAVPEGTPGGAYQLHTGAYWLDTMQRWSVQSADGTPSDRIRLGSVTIGR